MDASPLSHAAFYLAAVPAIALVGLSKGGLGGAAGFVGVPMMALVISPVQAAAILLPILVLMDVVSLWTWRGTYDRQSLVYTLPFAVPGIALGWWLAASVTPNAIRLIIGAVAFAFVARWAWGRWSQGADRPPAQPSRLLGGFWGFVAGFTSFVAHLGGPPFQVYMLPLRLAPVVFTGTSAIFFAATNFMKLVPYAALGQFSAANLSVSAALMPLAPIFTLLGAWLVRRMRPEVFYPLTYLTIGAVAAKLIWDGLAAIL